MTQQDYESYMDGMVDGIAEVLRGASARDSAMVLSVMLGTLLRSVHPNEERRIAEMFSYLWVIADKAGLRVEEDEDGDFAVVSSVQLNS